MQRRDVLKFAVSSAAAAALQQNAPALPRTLPIIDTHIHLFDPTRPGGVPWPEKSDTALYMPTLPERYVAQSAPFGVVGAIAIEASPLAGDNDWLLKVAANHPVMVGIVGNLVPGSASHLKDLERLHGDPLFLGIRYGNLWKRDQETDDLGSDMRKPGFVDGLKALAHAGLVLDSANPDPQLIRGILSVSEQVPDLRIVIDHLPHSPVPTEKAAREEYLSNLRQLARNTRVFVKLSEIPVVANGKLITDISYYREALDAIWDLFGDDRILFGSDWPNSDHVTSYANTFAIVRGYMATKSAEAREKYFWKNSIAAYKWHRRSLNQPAL